MDKAFKKQVQVAFEEFAGRKVKNKAVDIAVRHAQRIQETDPSLSTEDCIDQAIMKTIKDGVAF